MRLLVLFPRGRWLKKGISVETSIMKETRVVRLYRPSEFRYGRVQLIHVDAIVPEGDDRIKIMPGDARWMEDGSFKTQAYWWDNRTTLSPFLESGLSQMDVTEVES